MILTDEMVPPASILLLLTSATASLVDLLPSHKRRPVPWRSRLGLPPELRRETRTVRVKIAGRCNLSGPKHLCCEPTSGPIHSALASPGA